VFILTMTAFSSGKLPPIIFNKADDLFNFHLFLVMLAKDK